MVHPKPPTPVATDNKESNSTLNVIAKNKSEAMDMIFYWVRDII